MRQVKSAKKKVSVIVPPPGDTLLMDFRATLHAFASSTKRAAFPEPLGPLCKTDLGGREGASTKLPLAGAPRPVVPGHSRKSANTSKSLKKVRA